MPTVVLGQEAYRPSATAIQRPVEAPVAEPGTPTYRALRWLQIPGGQGYFVGTNRSPEPSRMLSGPDELLIRALHLQDLSVTPLFTAFPTLRAEAAPVRMTALDALDAIRSDLGITLDDIARITGIGRTTFHYWRRTGADPRPSTVKPLWRLNAIGRAVAGRLGVDQALGWFRSGSPSPLDLLVRGDIGTVEELASRWLFTQPSLRRAEASLSVEEEIDVGPGASAEAARHSRRRPTRQR